MANNWYLVSALTGGADGALDALDGDALNDGDRAIAIISDGPSFYIMDADSAEVDDGESIIKPNSNAGDKRWIKSTVCLSLPLTFENYDSVNYPITESEEASIDVYDSFAHGRDHVINVASGYESLAGGCAALSGDGHSITEIQEGWTVICGGYQNSISAGEYSGILAGSFNSITCDTADPAYNNLICGGEGNEITVVAGAYEYNTICGGQYNGITNYCTECVIAGGDTNSIVGSVDAPVFDSVIAGGVNNEITKKWAVVCGGNSNSNYGEGGFIGAGDDNDIEAPYGIIPGGIEGKAYLHGQWVHSTMHGSGGREQASQLVCGNTTTDTTETELYIDGLSLRVIIPASRSLKFTIDLIGRQTGGTVGTIGDSAVWSITGGIKRDASNNTVLIGTPQGTGVPGANDRDSAAAAWLVSVTADDTNESLKIAVTGESDKNIKWVARISLVEVG